MTSRPPAGYPTDLVRRIARQNGWILVFCSPIGFLSGLSSVPVASWLDVLLSTLGACLSGAIFLIPGILAIRWGRSSPRESEGCAGPGNTITDDPKPRVDAHSSEET